MDYGVQISQRIGGVGKFSFVITNTTPPPYQSLDWEAKGVIPFLAGECERYVKFIPFPYSNISYSGVNIGGYNLQTWKDAVTTILSENSWRIEAFLKRTINN